LIKGMIKGAKERKQRAEKAKDRARMFSFAQGMQMFPDAIGKLLAGSVHVGTEVTSVTYAGGFVVRHRDQNGEHTTPADMIIIATPASHAANILAPLSSSLSSDLEQIYYPPVAEVFLGFKADRIARPLDGFGFLVPVKEKRQILGTIWSSSLFPHRAPEGHVAFTSFVGGSRQPELFEKSDDDLLGLVTAELHSIMNVTGAPAFAKVIRWQKAIPQYNLGYHHVVEKMEHCERKYPGLFFCSNFKGGIAVGDCVMNGKKVSEKVISLQQNSRRPA
jgi:protoporphyrinogen/coproporphyrinogen III oxidase